MHKIYFSRKQSKFIVTHGGYDGDAFGGVAYNEFNDPATAAIGASLGSAVIGGIASSDAADQQAAAADRASANQQAATKFEQDQLKETKANLQPYVNSGNGAALNLQNGTTGNGEFNTPFTMNDLNNYKSPAYQFTQQQGEQALNRQLAQQGRYGSGAAIKSLGQYDAGLASQTAQDAFNNYNTDLGNRFNRLSSVAGLGANAAAGLGSNANAAAGNVANSTNTAGNYITQSGNANAAGTVGAANAFANPLSTIGSLGMLKQFQNPVGNSTSYNIGSQSTNPRTSEVFGE